MNRMCPMASMVIVAAVSGSPVIAAPPAARAELEARIKAMATKHAEVKGQQTQAALETFRGDAAVIGMTPAEVSEVYDTTYAQELKARAPGPFADFAPNLGWAAAAVLFILLLFKDALRDWFKARLKAASEWAHQRLVGHPLWRGVALRRYRAALVRKYKTLTLPFRRNKPLNLDEVYVPLRCRGPGERYGSGVDVRDAVGAAARVVLTGAPGSGKSMLLKALVLSYGKGRIDDIPGRAVPVLLELSRLRGSKQALDWHIIEELARNDFPRADVYVASWAEQGKLLLLLDGLDEIPTKERGDAVLLAKDFLARNQKCRAVVTCRTAVYRGDFDGTADQVFEVQELTDQQLRRMLGSWRSEMPTDKSVEHLLQTLHDRPQIVAVARNPLMLTIIASLYADTGFVLPHSRAEFYRQATDLLLGPWHRAQNQYEARAKRSILEGLALFNAVQTDPDQDARSIPYQAVLENVRTALPKLNLRSEESGSILEEIVERSGLLLLIDGGQRYQFAHLTVQEYFAAQALIDKGGELVTRFDADPDRWRETVKLWCGLAPDSTAVVREVSKSRPVTGFECLADALKVDQIVADALVERFKPQLAENDTRCLQAFGAVAADLRPRGQAVYDFLKETLAESQDEDRRAAAAAALSRTNLPQAASLLADYYTQGPSFRAALVRMGDLAVAALVSKVKKGTPDALNDLRAIGTPAAAEGVVPLLWHDDQDLARRAAWSLAGMLSQPDVESALRDYRLTLLQRTADRIDYVWQPFAELPESSLPVIAGRIARLMSVDPNPYDPTAAGTVDPRLTIPLCGVEVVDGLKPDNLKQLLKADGVAGELRNALGLARDPGLAYFPPRPLDRKTTILDRYEDTRVACAERPGACDAGWTQFLERNLDACGAARVPRLLLGVMPTPLRVMFLRNVIKGPVPKPKDWVNVRSWIKFKMIESPLYVLLLVAVTASLLIPFVRAGVDYWNGRAFWSLPHVVGMSVGVLALAEWWLLITTSWFHEPPDQREDIVGPAVLMLPIAIIIIVSAILGPAKRYFYRFRFLRRLLDEGEDLGHAMCLL